MKKVLYMAASLLVCITILSCSKEEVGGTATESMAGQWYCTIDAVDENGNIITQALDGSPNKGEDYFGLEGRTLVLTYNTAANDPTKMWVNIMGVGNFAGDYGNPNYPDYDFITQVNCNQGTLTFSSVESANIAEPVVWTGKDDDGNEIEIARVDPMPVSIDGKILKGAGRQNNGSPADSIIMFVTYKDDPWYPDDGYAKYKISGVRYSGLAEND